MVRRRAAARATWSRCSLLLKHYWEAVATVFPKAWDAPPRRSRLVHGVGIIALGCLMDEIVYRLDDPCTRRPRSSRRNSPGSARSALGLMGSGNSAPATAGVGTSSRTPRGTSRTSAIIFSARTVGRSPTTSPRAPLRNRSQNGGRELSATTLADRLRTRLAEIDAERARIAAALAALEPSTNCAPNRRTNLIEAIRASPGSRTSMLALISGASAASVAAELHALAADGIVERDGLGWRLTDAAAPEM